MIAIFIMPHTWWPSGERCKKPSLGANVFSLTAHDAAAPASPHGMTMDTYLDRNFRSTTTTTILSTALSRPRDAARTVGLHATALGRRLAVDSDTVRAWT